MGWRWFMREGTWVRTKSRDAQRRLVIEPLELEGGHDPDSPGWTCGKSLLGRVLSEKGCVSVMGKAVKTEEGWN
jgi:hypothetical protein